MNDGDDVNAPMQQLLQLIEDDRLRRRAAIESQCDTQASTLLREARHTARARLGNAIAAERTRLRAALEALEARVSTERRLAQQRGLRARLDIAWRELPRALQARWAAPAERMAWAQGICAAAAGSLQPQGWRIVHAAGWPAAERARLAAELAARGIAAPEFVEDAALGAGLAVRAGANTVDGTLRGLLADRSALGARLSAALAPAEIRT